MGFLLMNWQDKIIKKVNEKAKKEGVKCDCSHPFFHRIIAIQSSKEKTITKHKQQQKKARNNGKYNSKWN